MDESGPRSEYFLIGWIQKWGSGKEASYVDIITIYVP